MATTKTGIKIMKGNKQMRQLFAAGTRVVVDKGFTNEINPNPNPVLVYTS